MQPLTWRRLAGRSSAVAVVVVACAAATETLGTVVAGRVAAGPSAGLVGLLAVLLIGSALADVAAEASLAGALGRAEGRRRLDLLHAALHQPLPVLEEQAVGELLDRVDDDTRQLGVLVRGTGWQVARSGLRSVLAWGVAGLTWWPAWIAFPLAAVIVAGLVRPLGPVLARCKVAEEEAWSGHAAQLEEAVAARDDVRTSLGQPHVVRQYAERAAQVLARVRATRAVGTAATLRTGLVLHAMLAGVVVGGAALVAGGQLGVAGLVTLWLLVTAFAGQLVQVADRLPDVQEGLGALTRIRGLLAAPQEPVGGLPVPPGPAGIAFRGLTAGYPGGGFTLREIDLVVPAGTTCALVGRTGAGKSTLAKLLSRAVEPPVGTVSVGGRDVTTIDMEALRRAVGVVTQRTEILAASLRDNITLFADVPPGVVQDAVDALGLAPWAAALPEGLDTRFGPGGTTLSAGEEQLVAFARLLVRDVAVVVLDEATARMDPQTEQLVGAATDRLLAGRTGIVIAHRLSTVARCDAVAVLDRGRIVQHGAHAVLAAASGPFGDLLAAASGAGPGGTPAAVPGGSRPPRAPAGEVPAARPAASGGPRTAEVAVPVGLARVGASGGPCPPAAAVPVRLARMAASGGPRTAEVAVPVGLARMAASGGPRTAEVAVPVRLARMAASGGPRTAEVAVPVRLARIVWRTALTLPRWGLLGAASFVVSGLLGAYGVVSGLLWGRLVAALQAGADAWPDAVGLAVCLLLSPLSVAVAFRAYPMWWTSVSLRARLAVLRGQTMQHRLARTPPGEVVARALDSDRLVLYVDRWVDAVSGVLIAAVTALAARSALAGAVVVAVLAAAVVLSSLGAPAAGAAGRRAADARGRFGAALGSVLDAARTVKLAAATAAVQHHLEEVDRGRVAAGVREQRVLALVEGARGPLVQAGVAAAWAAHLVGVWDLATALLVTTTVSGCGWYASQCGSVVTEAPIARRWLQAAADLSGGADPVALPPGVDLLAGTAPPPAAAVREPLRRLTLRDVSAVHDDGTVGVTGIDLVVEAGSLVLLTGRVGSGKSSLLAGLAGLVDHTGGIHWNSREIDDPQRFLRPGQVAYVGQVPRVLSGSFTDNIALGHGGGALALPAAVADARLGTDVTDAGGLGTLVGHRGVRLSGGQVQRVALARALAAGAELLIADDVSSALDARTELELWDALRARGVTVVGATSKHAALARADCVVVLEEGRIAATGRWRELAAEWGHLAG